MTDTPPDHRPTTPAEIIALALDDHWITSPPSEPLYHSQAADQVLDYLHGYGYAITHDTRTASLPPYRPTGCGHVAFTGFLTLACVAGGTISLARQDWGWFVAGTVGACLLGYELLQDLTAHRRGRRQDQR